MPISKSIKATAKFAKDFYQNGGNDDEDVYGDDFDASTDSEREDTSKLESSQNKTKDQSFTSTRYGSVYSEPLDSARRGYGSSYSKATTGNHKRMKGNRKGRDSSRPPQSSNNVIAQRVLSARRNKINSLQNLVLELQNEVDQLRIENRDLKRSSRIQEKVIKKLDDDEADLPLLLQKHNSEVRTLKEKLKKQKDRSERLQEEVKKKDLELLKLRDKVGKYEEIMKEKRLDERERLQQKLEKLESELGEKEGKISELEKVVKLSEKVRIREIKERNDKYKKAIEELRRLENMQRDLQGKFKEKEKELHTQNIYSQRIALKRKTMRSQQLTLDSRIEDTPLSSRNDNSGTPRFREMKENEPAPSYNENIENSQLGSADVSVETMMSALRKKEEELEKILVEEQRRKQFEEDKRKLQEMEDKIKLKQDEIKQADERKEEERRRFEMERFEEDKLLEQRRRERLEKEEEERKMREMEEEKKKIAEMEYRARQREEERKIIEALEDEKAKEEQRRTIGEVSKESAKEAELELGRRLAEQKARQKNLEDQLKTENEMKSDDLEAQRKKDILLARMKAIDERNNIANDNSKTYKGFQTSKFDDGNSQLVTKNEKKKPIFLQDSTNDDKEAGVKHKPLDFSAKRRGSKTEYNFKAADENLHRGLPSHPDVNKTNQQDLTFGAYSPTVGSGGKKRVSQFKNNEKKTDEDFLFFDTNAKSSPAENSRRGVKKETEDFPFFDTKKTKAPLVNDKPDGIFQINSDKNKKPELNRNRTKSVSDDDSLMFTIGGKKPDRSKPERNSGDSAKDRKSTAGSGKRVFGSYEPTFANSGSGNSTAVMSPSSDPFADDGPKFGRRQGQQKTSGALGDMVLSSSNDDNKPNDFTKTLFDSGRRKADKVGTTAVKAIDSFVDDDIEEMVLT